MTSRLLTFVHMSDTHIHIDPEHREPFYEHPSRASVLRLIEAINRLDAAVDCMIHTGDIVHHPESAEHYHVARGILDLIRFPVYYTTGNHDNVRLMQEAFFSVPAYSVSPHYD